MKIEVPLISKMHCQVDLKEESSGATIGPVIFPRLLCSYVPHLVQACQENKTLFDNTILTNKIFCLINNCPSRHYELSGLGNRAYVIHSCEEGPSHHPGRSYRLGQKRWCSHWGAAHMQTEPAAKSKTNIRKGIRFSL